MKKNEAVTVSQDTMILNGIVKQLNDFVSNQKIYSMNAQVENEKIVGTVDYCEDEFNSDAVTTDDKGIVIGEYVMSLTFGSEVYFSEDGKSVAIYIHKLRNKSFIYLLSKEKHLSPLGAMQLLIQSGVK